MVLLQAAHGATKLAGTLQATQECIRRRRPDLNDLHRDRRSCQRKNIRDNTIPISWLRLALVVQKAAVAVDMVTAEEVGGVEEDVAAVEAGSRQSWLFRPCIRLFAHSSFLLKVLI